MKILVVGGGGREHALTWKLSRSPRVEQIFVASGNAGTARIATNIACIKVEEILNWVRENPVDLVVIGPDDVIALGLVDELVKIGIPVFGPTRAAGEIEWSKSFAKDFMQREGIPTARYKVFSEIERAKEYIATQPLPLVVKASGLALGKGVRIVQTHEEARLAIEEIMKEQIFGEAGREVVIEEFLEGKEISVHAFCDGESAVLFPPSQDHKRIFENSHGPNTGGMGTIAPIATVADAEMQDIHERIVIPTLRGLQKMGRMFKGILYPGVMLTTQGPKVIEFNARFGDPETQSYMRILETDLVEILLSCTNGTLREQKVKWSQNYASCVVLASGGYPGKYETGKVIHGLEDSFDSEVVIFHAGTAVAGQDVVTRGGRVLGVTALGETLNEAVSKAYTAVEKISFDGMQFRRDIGAQQLRTK